MIPSYCTVTPSRFGRSSARGLTIAAAVMAGHVALAQNDSSSMPQAAAAAQAEAASEPGSERGMPREFAPQPSASLEVWALSLLSSDFKDTNGDVSATFGRAELNADFPLSGNNPANMRVLTLSAGVQVSSYEFSNGALQPVSAPPSSEAEPWDTLYTMDVSLAYRAPIDDRWGYVLGAGIASSFESGAEIEDTLTYGGFAAVTYAFSQQLIVGGGAFISTRLEDDVRILPVPFIRWQASESVSVSTGAGTGPTGPGVSVFYAIDDRWTAGLSVGFRTVEARLDDDGTSPGGVARHQAVPIVASLSWQATENLQLTALAGYTVAQTYELLNSDGLSLVEEDAEGAPTFALVAKIAF